MSFTIEHHALKDVLHESRAMSRIQHLWTYDQYKDRINQRLSWPCDIIIARDDQQRLIGTTAFRTQFNGAENFNYIPELRDEILKHVDSLTQVQLRTFVYVDPARQGEGIASAMEKRTDDISRDLGYTHWLMYYYNDESIASFVTRNGAIELETEDTKGNKVYLIPFGP